MAREFRISSCYLGQIVKKFTRNKNFLKELVQHQEEKESQRCGIQRAITEMIQKKEFIDSVDYVQKRIKEDTDVENKRWTLRKVMKEDAKLSYKKVKGVQ